jgi:hypothetical protein
MRGLAAIGAILGAAARFHGQKAAHLHLVWIEMAPVYGLAENRRSLNGAWYRLPFGRASSRDADADRWAWIEYAAALSNAVVLR